MLVYYKRQKIYFFSFLQNIKEKTNGLHLKKREYRERENKMESTIVTVENLIEDTRGWYWYFLFQHVSLRDFNPKFATFPIP